MMPTWSPGKWRAGDNTPPLPGECSQFPPHVVGSEGTLRYEDDKQLAPAEGTLQFAFQRATRRQLPLIQKACQPVRLVLQLVEKGLCVGVRSLGGVSSVPTVGEKYFESH